MSSYKEQIEQLVKVWNKINNTTDWNNWADMVKKTNFGTYGTINLTDVIKNTNVKFPTSWVKDSFINEFNDAKNNIKLN